MDTTTVACRSSRGMTRLAALSLAAGTLSLLGSIAFAGNTGEKLSQPAVTVRAPRVIRHTSVGNGGIAVQQLSLTREVSFADLNLDTPQGKAALHARLRDNARQACRELETRYPSLLWMDDVQSCVHQAMLTWMPQVHAIPVSFSER